MKKVIAVILFTLVFSQGWSIIPTVSIEQAIRENIISAQFQYASGPHHRSIKTRLQNRTNKAYCVAILPGTLLESEVESYQNHLVTKHDTFYLQPKTSRDVILSAMCCESHDGCPELGSRFTLKHNSRSEMIALCKLADSMHLSGYETQTAIWALANKSNPNIIYGSDSLQVMTLRNFVGTYLHMPVEVYHTSYYVKRVKPSVLVPFNVDNTIFVDSLTMNDKISLELYSENDELINPIPHEQQFIYMNTLNLFLSCITLSNLSPSTSYIVRLKKNNVVYREWLYMVA